MKKFIEWLKRIFGFNKPPVPTSSPSPSRSPIPKPSPTPIPENCKFDIDVENITATQKSSPKKVQKTWDGKKRSRKR